MKENFRLWAIATLLSLGLCTAAPCAARSSPDSHQGTQKPYSRPIPPRAEERLQRAVRHELLMLPYYSVFDNLEYKVVDYRVELYGQVVWPTLKSDAASAVEHIEGVEGVDNHIEVLPLSSFDNRIRRSVYRAIYFQPAMQKYGNIPVPPIHIIVKNGHVTLVGVVDNEMDREIAFIQADGVPGVFSVTNKLRVDR